MSIQLNIDAIDAGDLLKQLTALAQALTTTTEHVIIAHDPMGETKNTRSRKAPAETKDENPTKSAGTAPTPASSTETKTSDPANGASVETGNASAATADTAASTSEASAPAAEGEGKKTYADVRAAMLKLTTAKSRDAAIELLTKYKVGKAQELTEDQYEGVIKDALDAAAAE